MAIYHCSIKIISRGKGKSAVAAAAYRSGETITNEYDGITHDYTRKGSIIHTEILLPDHAPREYADRAFLWNAVEKVEKARNSQLAREIEIALPAELTLLQNRSLVREYVKRHFVSAGMCADICIHDKNDGNPHVHIMLTMRPINEDGSWEDKQKKEYILNKNGEKVYDPKKRQYKCKSVAATDWNEQTKAEEWRAAWADIVNQYLGKLNHTERIDHRSYERQGVDQIPTIHLGVAAFQMEKRGIATDRGNTNRNIMVTNQRLRQLKARITKLENWLKEEAENTAPPTLADVISDILNRQGQSGISKLKAASQMLIFLQENEIADMAGLDDKIKSMLHKQSAIREKLKPVERRLKTLDEHIKQADYYFEFKPVHTSYKQMKNPKKAEAFYEEHRREITLYESAAAYLKDVMNGHTTIPTKAWKTESDKLKTELRQLDGEYVSLKGEVQKVEQIRRGAYDVLRNELLQNKNNNKNNDMTI